MTVTMHMRAERRFLHISGTKLHIDFHVQIAHKPAKPQKDRAPLTLACVVDRSGSMSGTKMTTAKDAVQAVIDRLDERDQVSVVIFDDEINVIQPLTKVTTSSKSAIREVLSTVQARGSTALHEGWLTGCNSIAESIKPNQHQGLARCFLLTDGLANVGITDPETIATQAGGIRRETGIGTSTFGIGNDYNEALLGPMAVAGGGQFHHLRTAKEISSTFIGELGSLLAVDASQIRLEVEYVTDVETNLVSTYWSNTTPGATPRQSITIGEARGGEEFHVVMDLNFPAQQQRDGITIRARMLWVEDGQEHHSNWQEMWFSYTDEQTYNQEQADPQVIKQVALQKADQARIGSIESNKKGDYAGAKAKMTEAMEYVKKARQRAPSLDAELAPELDSLSALAPQVSSAPMPAAPAKEAYYQAQRRSRSQSDHRTTTNNTDTQNVEPTPTQEVEDQPQRGIIPNFLKRTIKKNKKETY